MSKKQTIFRAPKNAMNPYVMISNELIQDSELSFRAKGIMAYILSRPDCWQVTIRDLMKHGKEGRDAIYKGLKELVQYGYLEQHVSVAKEEYGTINIVYMNDLVEIECV